ncbi:hypothetical protein CYMTET_32537 [Cymbomonas tetramitiformis]|uniref:MATH domain-containing protein n=1 Tax=Cymbomonas tetramitiformis TaxID=36881 RepID=A0AAE0FEV2_9CHLO|nr:hypothetical protein CYMTET_32537 [Cymbomonas tetramitiformis]
MRTRRRAKVELNEAKRAALKNEESSLLFQLPTEILVLTLSHLSARELAAANTICKRFCLPCEGGGALSPTEAAARGQVLAHLEVWEERGSNPVPKLVGCAKAGVTWARALWWYVQLRPEPVCPTWTPACENSGRVGAYQWKIDGFSSLASFKSLSIALFPKHLQRTCFFTYSAPFMVGGLPWRLMVFPQGNHTDHLSIYLDVPDSEQLPVGWTRFASFQLSVINQCDASKSIRKDTRHHFNTRENDWGFTQVVSLSELCDKEGGFIVDDNLILEVEIDCRSPGAGASTSS